MKRSISRIIILVGLLATMLPAASIIGATEPVERIVAVVGREPIMASELAAQIQLIAIQQGLRPETEKELEKLQKDILDQMISERLFLIEARKDTSIRVSQEEIDQAIEDHIARVSEQFDSQDQFLNQLAAEGLTLRSFRKKLRPEVENQLLKQRLIARKLSEISLSRQEVMEFYEQFKDSLPNQPEAVRLAHILITFQSSQKTVDSIRQIAEKVRENAAAGADFATLAITYSSGPTALSGGDLGMISRNDVVDEFGRAAFALAPGDISGIVRTQFGLHIIKCEEIAGNQGRFRHILFEIEPTPADSLLSYRLVDSLMNEIGSGADFRELAKIYSADDESRKQGGELGWFALADLPPSFVEALEKIPEGDSLYGPVESEYGLHILKKLDYQEGRVLTFEDDYDQIKEMARQSKTGEFVDGWLEEIKEKTYVEIRDFK